MGGGEGEKNDGGLTIFSPSTPKLNFPTDNVFVVLPFFKVLFVPLFSFHQFWFFVFLGVICFFPPIFFNKVHIYKYIYMYGWVQITSGVTLNNITPLENF